MSSGILNRNLEMVDFASDVEFKETVSVSRFYAIPSQRIAFINYRGEQKTHAQSEVIFTVPEAYKPIATLPICYVSNTEAYGNCYLNSNGSLTVGFATVSGRININIAYPY